MCSSSKTLNNLERLMDEERGGKKRDVLGWTDQTTQTSRNILHAILHRKIWYFLRTLQRISFSLILQAMCRWPWIPSIRINILFIEYLSWTKVISFIVNLRSFKEITRLALGQPLHITLWNLIIIKSIIVLCFFCIIHLLAKNVQYRTINYLLININMY